jgi:hypothetical protein
MSFISSTIILPLYVMIAKIFPVTKRGRFLDITNFIGNGAGVLGATVLPIVRDKGTFPLARFYQRRHLHLRHFHRL